MNISSATSAVSSAIQGLSTDNDIAMAVAGKAMDAEKQEGANALQLIAATGMGQHIDRHA